MRFVGTIVGGLTAIAVLALSVPGSARAMPLAPGAAMMLDAEAPALTEKAQYRRYYDPRVRCIRAPCYVQRYHRPRYRRYYQPRYYGPRVVCRVRYGYYGRGVSAVGCSEREQARLRAKRRAKPPV